MKGVPKRLQISEETLPWRTKGLSSLGKTRNLTQAPLPVLQSGASSVAFGASLLVKGKSDLQHIHILWSILHPALIHHSNVSNPCVSIFRSSELLNRCSWSASVMGIYKIFVQLFHEDTCCVLRGKSKLPKFVSLSRSYESQHSCLLNSRLISLLVPVPNWSSTTGLAALCPVLQGSNSLCFAAYLLFSSMLVLPTSPGTIKIALAWQNKEKVNKSL